MFYVYLLLSVLILVFGFFYWKRGRLAGQFVNRAAMQIQYRFHHLESVGVEYGKAKNGALLFSVKRISLDTRNVVIKDVKINHPSVHVSLDQLIMITFPAESNQAYEASVRFRIRGHSRNSNFMSQRQATIIGYITSESSGRTPFRIQIPIMQLADEIDVVGH